MTAGRAFSLKASPGFGRRELVHITGFIMRFVPKVECQLEPQAYFLLKGKDRKCQFSITSKNGMNDSFCSTF